MEAVVTTMYKEVLRLLLKVFSQKQCPLCLPETGSNWINLPYLLKNPAVISLVPKMSI